MFWVVYYQYWELLLVVDGEEDVIWNQSIEVKEELIVNQDIRVFFIFRGVRDGKYGVEWKWILLFILIEVIDSFFVK